MDIGAAVGRKIGPLPAWGWGVAIGGAILAVRYLKGGTQRSAEPILVPTGAPPVQPSTGFTDTLANAVGEIREQIGTLTTEMVNLRKKVEATPPPASEPVKISPIFNPPVPGPVPPSIAPPPPPISAKPDPLAGIPWPSTWPTYARTSLQAAKDYAHNIIQNYSPGGAFYGQAAVGDRYRIPYIPTGVLSAGDQYALAKQYGGLSGLRYVSVQGGYDQIQA